MITKATSIAKHTEPDWHMRVIKNGEGKTVCRVDAACKLVEIVFKRQKTEVQFLDDGTIETKNTRIEMGN